MLVSPWTLVLTSPGMMAPQHGLAWSMKGLMSTAQIVERLATNSPPALRSQRTNSPLGISYPWKLQCFITCLLPELLKTTKKETHQYLLLKQNNPIRHTLQAPNPMQSSQISSQVPKIPWHLKNLLSGPIIPHMLPVLSHPALSPPLPQLWTETLSPT